MEFQEFVALMPWTMIAQICNLLILMLLMKKFLFKPVQNILAKRQKEIDGIYEAAEQDRASASEMRAEYTQRLAGARNEADRLVRTAVDEANRKGDEILDGARSQAMHLKQKAEAEISQERLKVYSELKREISGMAVDIAEKMVGREISEADQRSLVEDFLRNAGDES